MAAALATGIVAAVAATAALRVVTGPPLAWAGLPGNKAIVCVGPPFLPSGASMGLMGLASVPTRLWLTPFVRPEPVPSPIKLNELFGDATTLTKPLISAGDVPVELPATIVSISVAVPCIRDRPAPGWLPVNVHADTVSVP